MSELIVPSVIFTTLYGERHRLGITPEWGVILDNKLAEKYKPPAAVMLLGFAQSLNSIIPWNTFYENVRKGYDDALEKGATGVSEVDRDRTATNLSSFLGNFIISRTSPIITNIIRLPHGASKKLLFAKDPANEESVKGVFDKSKFSENPEINARLQHELFGAYKTQKDSRLKHSVSRDRAKYVPSEDVLKVVGEHVLGFKPGAIFSEQALAKTLDISLADRPTVINALSALQRAGYLLLSEKGAHYVRTKEQKPEPKIS